MRAEQGDLKGYLQDELRDAQIVGLAAGAGRRKRGIDDLIRAVAEEGKGGKGGKGTLPFFSFSEF